MMIRDSLNKLKRYIENEDYHGYDPYDTLNSPLARFLIGKWLPIAAIQFQKRNPINIRPILGIKKDINPKAIGLCLSGYAKLNERNPQLDDLKRMELMLDWLHDHGSKGFSGICWGYNFPWASSKKFTAKYSPNIVVSAFVAKGLFDYFKATGSKIAIEMIKSVAEFIVNDIPESEDRTGICFSYTTDKKDCCYNASLLGAEILAKLYSVSGEERLRDKAHKALEFVIARQKRDGRWNYSVDLVTGVERTQIDFHQGYILESIYQILKYLKISENRYEISLKKGIEFYRERQFHGNGRSQWRLPKHFPVDIHNQAQGIITFSLLKDYSDEYLEFAGRIAEWTINNMQDHDGFFYYRCNKLFKNKISYLRWSQAWMMLALSTLWVEAESNQ